MRSVPALVVGVVVCLLTFISVPAAQTPAERPLDIYFVDTEGGQATLYVAPSGQTLLVDTGNAGSRDLERILAVLATAGVTRIDHLFLTHYHGDHYGNVIDLAARMPVGHLYDHGASIEADRPNVQAFEARYAELYRKTPRRVVAPGDAVPVAGLETVVVASHSRPLATPIKGAPGAGQANAACAGVAPRDESKVDPDNHYSAGFVMTFGRFRTVNLGDLTWSRELTLMCPVNPIGTVDLYLTTHHGLDQSGSPAVVHALRPRVAVMNNGTRKGGAVASFQTLRSSPGLEDIWQLHWSYHAGIEHNAPGVMIANLDDAAQVAAVVGGGAAGATLPAGPGGNAAHTPAHYLKVSARRDGSFTVTNSRNGFTRTYAARP
ncbi:MAG: ComEC/Rec2 family competence protein [Vicinamibacterales bacterium]